MYKEKVVPEILILETAKANLISADRWTLTLKKVLVLLEKIF